MVLRRAKHGRAVGFCQPIGVNHFEAGVFHRVHDGGRRGRARSHHIDGHRQRALLAGGGVHDEVQHDRGTAEMGDVILRDGFVDIGCADAPQTDIRATLHGDCPRKTPAAAVKEWQCPQVHRIQRQAPNQGIADGIQIRPTMMVDHALWVAGGP